MPPTLSLKTDFQVITNDTASLDTIDICSQMPFTYLKTPNTNHLHEALGVKVSRERERERGR